MVARGRLSVFLALGGSFAEERARMQLTAFYQPRWSELADARAIAQLGLEVELAGGLSLTVRGALQVDSRPPVLAKITV